jgi:hypothetical protein
MTILRYLDGKKTYLTVLAIAVLLFGSWQQWWTIPGEFYAALAALALAFLRSGVAKAAQPQPVPVKRGTLDLYPLLLAAGIAAAIVAGCHTTNTPGRILATSSQTVSAAMDGWWTYELLTQPPQEQVDQVRQGYAAWQLSQQAAEAAYNVHLTTGKTDAWQAAADALRASQATLLQLVHQFNPP